MAIPTCFVFIVLLYAATASPLAQTTVCETQNHPYIPLPSGLDTPNIFGLGFGYPYYQQNLPYGLLPYLYGSSKTIDSGSTTVCETIPSPPKLSPNVNIVHPSSGSTTVCETLPNVPVTPNVFSIIPLPSGPVNTATVTETLSSPVVNVLPYPQIPVSGTSTVCETLPNPNVLGVIQYPNIPLSPTQAVRDGIISASVPFPGLFPGLGRAQLEAIFG